MENSTYSQNKTLALAIKLAWKFIRREFAQGQLNLLILAIFIAITSLSSIGFLIKRLDSSMINHAAQLNGAELVLKSATEIPPDWQQQAQKSELTQAKMISFPSMLVVNDQFKLARIKAVSATFPLLGKLMVKSAISAPAKMQQAPPPGTIWLDQRLYQFFNNLPINSQVELGDAFFKANGILQSVPGQSSTLFNIAPAAMINLADLEKTATIQPGSRVEYIYFFTGTEKALKNYRNWLKTKLYPGQSLRYGAEGVQAVSKNIEKAGNFLSLAALLTVFLSAIAITISSFSYEQKQYKKNAILLCLGLTENFIIKIELIKMLLLAVITSALGVAAGYSIHLLILNILAELIPKPLPPLSFLPLWTSLICGILLISSISINNLFHIRQLSPMAILRNDRVQGSLNHYFLYASSLITLILLSWFYTQNLKITILFYASIIAAIAVLLGLATLLFKALFTLNKRFKLIQRLAIINLRQHKQMALIQIASFSLIIALICIVYLGSSDLLKQWQQQLPANTPNHFVINLQSYEKQQFAQMLDKHSIQASDLYPMVRGRLSLLNDRPVKDAISPDAKQHNALNRELNLSFALKMPVHNQLVKGDWWHNQSQDNAYISLESELAEKLGIKLGDKLGFQIGSQQVHGIVKNFRKVKWDSFKPNFYVIFSSGVIDQFPLSYISSFYLDKNNKLLLNQIIEQFPGISIIEVDQILKEVLYIIDKMAMAINFVFIFILIAGLLVLSSSLSSTMESRMFENAIIRTLGASAKKLRHSLFIEFAIIAFLSALIGLIIAEIVSAILFIQVFNFNYSLHPILWIVVTLISVVLISSMALAQLNKIFTRPVNYSLRYYGT